MRGTGHRALAALLVALMALGSLVLWIGIPLFWIWLASQLATSSRPSMSLYTLIIVGIPISMVVVGKALAALNRRHMELTGSVDQRRLPTPWLKSMRGERELERDRGPLGRIMVLSVSLALTAMAVWFFFFAEGGGLPGT